MSTRRREEILSDLEREQIRLADLERQMRESTAKLEALRAELSGCGQRSVATSCSEPPAVYQPSPASSQAKIALFKSLFRGRTDVFPVRWESRKTGRAGYSPACTNEWAYGLCAKKDGAAKKRSGSICGGCENQAFRPVTEGEILKHLQGHQVMGVYPMLTDETCWFVAADFDKQDWQKDVTAYAETCRRFEVPVAIERSRSGNGAHAWILFGAPISASIARKLACFMVTETMARRHELGMESYDRLFPNQDNMPKGGFGNLIALPLQLKARDRGNTAFVDDKLTAYPDQWAYLSGLLRMEPDDALRLANEATNRGHVIGVKMCEVADEGEEQAPWLQPPSGHRPKTTIEGPLPTSVSAVLAQRLFVEKGNLPSALLDQMMRLAAFQNPEFYKRQSLRLSTALVPRVIACAEDFPKYISLPRGCRPDLESLLDDHGVRLEVDDEQDDGEPVHYEFNGELTPVQKQAVASLLANDHGVFVAPPGVGKTVVGTCLVAARRRSTLILVHRQALLDQWKSQLKQFLDLKPKDIGQIGAGKQKPNGLLDVAMLQSLVRKGEVKDLVAGYGHVIVDECHHIPAVSFEQVLSAMKSRYVTGLTATPRRRDGHHPITEMQLGPVRFSVDPRSQAAKRPFEHRLVVRDTGVQLAMDQAQASIQEIYGLLAADDHRNDRYSRVARFWAMRLTAASSMCMVLASQMRNHLPSFGSRIPSKTPKTAGLVGGPRRQDDLGPTAAALPVGEGQRAAVLLGDGPGNGEAEAGALGLGSGARREQPLAALR